MEIEFYPGKMEVKILVKNGRAEMLLGLHLTQTLNYLQFLLMEVMIDQTEKFLQEIKLNVKYHGYHLD